MSGPRLVLLAAIVASPVLAYLIYRAAKTLGFLDPPVDRQHELRRQILAALYAFLIFLPVFLFGWERRWQRLWIAFGVVSGVALLFFAASGLVSARSLWRVRQGAAAGAGPPSADAQAPGDRPALDT
jgi:cell division protein FtsW (lipid II flippase)